MLGSRKLAAGMGISLAGLMAIVSSPSQAATSPGQSADARGLSCDNSIIQQFKPNAQTKIQLVRLFKKGEVIPMKFSFRAAWLEDYMGTKVAETDLCLVKVLVGPGNPGPVDAPSTSSGIGIEVWLPPKSAWKGRVHAMGTGGSGGGLQSDPVTPAAWIGIDNRFAPSIAVEEGAVVSTSDTGHPGSSMDGSYAMNPDGTFNKTLYWDYSSRSVHVQAVVTKALATAYYGRAPTFSYFEGGSGAGRQALMLAQRYPLDYGGIIAAYPGVDITKFSVSNLYISLVVERDLGGKYMSTEQLDLVSNAAIAACDVVGGKHLGFIISPETCRYDPTKDPEVLCAASGGKNETPACVTREQALVINKMWYGMTTDGSVPDPAVDNGLGPLTGKRKGYGTPRGTNLKYWASDSPRGGGALLAVILRDPAMASPDFHNATGNGKGGWRSLRYAQLSDAFDLMVKMAPQLDYIDADNPDLSAFKKRGGKLIHYHGTNDQSIPYFYSVNYYNSVTAKMNGLKNVQDFYRFYLVPGMDHGLANGTSNPDANPPVTRKEKHEVFQLLTDWVEKGTPPQNIVLQSESDQPVAKSLPLCAYPTRVTYVSGDINAATSYSCK